MNPEYLTSLSDEFDSLRNRVRILLQGRHHATDGEWKESVLRSILRRHVPENIKVGQGFVVDGDNVSSQIDILLYDASFPTLYREQDLVIVTPDAVSGIIEVKTQVRRGDLVSAATALIANVEFITGRIDGVRELMAGIIAYTFEPGSDSGQWVLGELQRACEETGGGVISQLCLDRSAFVHYWAWEPGPHYPLEWYDQYHLYNLDGMAAGYFIHNVVESLAPESVRENHHAWFPPEGKEQYRVANLLRWTVNLHSLFAPG